MSEPDEIPHVTDSIRRGEKTLVYVFVYFILTTPIVYWINTDWVSVVSLLPIPLFGGGALAKVLAGSSYGPRSDDGEKPDDTGKG